MCNLRVFISWAGPMITLFSSSVSLPVYAAFKLYFSCNIFYSWPDLAPFFFSPDPFCVGQTVKLTRKRNPASCPYYTEYWEMFCASMLLECNSFALINCTWLRRTPFCPTADPLAFMCCSENFVLRGPKLGGWKCIQRQCTGLVMKTRPRTAGIQ